MNKNKKHSPQVTVITPVWNPGEGISRCVASLRGQTLKDIEMIFVDDCGTDGAMDVVRAAAADDPRIRIIANEKNMGAGASRNAAIEVARGEYLAFVDADDYVDACFLEKLYNKGKAEDLDIVKGGFGTLFENGEMAPTVSHLNSQIRVGLQKGVPLFSLFHYEFQSALYHRRLFANPVVRFGLTANGEDVTFLLKACHLARSFGIDDGTEYRLFLRQASATNAMTEDSLEARIAALKEQAGYLLKHADPNPYAAFFLMKKTRYYLSVQRHSSLIQGMEKESSRFLSELQALAADCQGVVELKEDDLAIYALVDYGVNLVDVLSYTIGGRPPLADYAAFVSDWSGFVEAHPECKARLFLGYSWLLEELCLFVLDIGRFGYDEEQETRMKALSQQVFASICHGGAPNPTPDAAIGFDALLTAMKEQADYLGSLGEADDKAVGHWTIRLKRLLSLQRHAGKKANMEQTASRFLSALRDMARGFTLLDPIKEEDLALYALIEYGENLVETPYQTPWSKPDADDYADLVAAWSGFFMEHPECKEKYHDGYGRFLEGFCAFVKRMDFLGYPPEETAAMKTLCRQVFSNEEWACKVFPFAKRLWYVSAGIIPKETFPPNPWDFGEVLGLVKYRVQLHTQLLANHKEEETLGFIDTLGKMLRLTPEIEAWAESSQQVEVRGVYDYGAALRPMLWGDYRTAPNYVQMLKNWQGFLVGHPDCEALYFSGYKRFLKDMQKFVGECEWNGCDQKGIEECKKALGRGWKGLPVKVRVRRRLNGLKVVQQRLKGKIQ